MQYFLESIVLVIYLWFKNILPYKKILIDTHTKNWKEITDIVGFSKKLLKFLQGVIVRSSGTAYCSEGYRHKQSLQNQFLLL